METTFYDDSQFRAMRNDYKSTKRPVTLDLESPGAFSKKQRFTTLLTSPDLHMLKLASPELERFIITQTGSITTTPTPTQFLFPKNVTEEQEQYARGFVDALAQLHQTGVDITGFTTPQLSDGTNVVNTSASQSALSRFYPGIIPFMQVANNTSSASSSATVPSSTKPIVNTSLSVVRPPSVESTSSNSYQGVSYLPLPHNITIKEEPQIVPSDSSGMSPPMSPINMENQEKIKLERKRHRNRIAASKCRRRKLERISRLEDKVRELKNENTELGTVASKLREQVCSLKQQVLNHAKSGCQIMVAHTF